MPHPFEPSTPARSAVVVGPACEGADPGHHHGPVRLGLDLTPLISGNTGVARFAEQLLAHLPEHPDVDVAAFAVGRTELPVPPGARHVRIPLRLAHASWRTIRAPGARWLAGPVDVVHSLDMVPPPARVPTIMTIHDLLPLHHPQHYGPRYIRIARAQAAAARRADGIVTFCASTAENIAEVTGVPLELITVAPFGQREPVREPAAPPVDGPYLLAVGALTSRKDFDLLAEAVGRLPETTPPLLIAGPDGWGAKEVRRRIAALGLGDRVRLLGRVSDRQLDGLYRGALLACHPSRAEGFGIPCLEALSLGVPLVAADIASVREICGGAAVLVPAGDVDALASSISALISDETRLAALAEAGLRRATQFSWSDMTKRIVGLYRDLAGSGRSGAC